MSAAPRNIDATYGVKLSTGHLFLWKRNRVSAPWRTNGCKKESRDNRGWAAVQVFAEGRHALSPSLYERDAYQAFLRKNPDQCSGLRFDVQCKAKAADWSRLRLRMEVRGIKEAKPLVLEQPVRRNPRYHRWSSLTLDGASYQKAGELIAWRATLWEGDKMLAQQKSFLW